MLLGRYDDLGVDTVARDFDVDHDGALSVYGFDAVVDEVGKRACELDGMDAAEEAVRGRVQPETQIDPGPSLVLDAFLRNDLMDGA